MFTKRSFSLLVDGEDYDGVKNIRARGLLNSEIFHNIASRDKAL